MKKLLYTMTCFSALVGCDFKTEKDDVELGDTLLEVLSVKDYPALPLSAAPRHETYWTSFGSDNYSTIIFDGDGNTNTAEIIAYKSTRNNIEAHKRVAEVKVGDKKTISEWRKHFSVRNNPISHPFVWKFRKQILRGE